MPLPYGWASESTVIQSPASRAARRRSCQVRSVSVARVRSRRPKANQRASSSRSRNRRSARNRSGVGRSPCGSRCGSHAATAASSGQRTPWIGADARRDALLALQVLRVGEVGEARGQGRREAVRVVGELGERRAERLGRVTVRGDEARRRRSVVALAGSVRRCGAVIIVRASTGRADRPSQRPSESRLGGSRSARGARACGPRRRRRRRRSPWRARSPVAAVDDAARRCRRPAVAPA